MRLERKGYDQTFQLDIVMFSGDLHQMSLKNRRSIGEFFSFHANRISLIILFCSKEHVKMRGTTEPFLKLVTFLSVKENISFMTQKMRQKRLLSYINIFISNKRKLNSKKRALWCPAS